MQENKQRNNLSNGREADNLFSEIEWPVRKPLADEEQWEKNSGVVELLCKIGTVTEWLEGEEDKDTYRHFPYQYDVKDIPVRFLPHWAFYSVGTVDLNTPQTEEDVYEAVEAVRKLESLGLKGLK